MAKMHYTKFKKGKAVVICRTVEQLNTISELIGKKLEKLPVNKVLLSLLKGPGYCVANNGYTGTVDYYKAQKDVLVFEYDDLIYDDLYIRINMVRKTVSLYFENELLNRVRCQDGDEFDVEIGLGLALERNLKDEELLKDLKIIESIGGSYADKAKFLVRKKVENLEEIKAACQTGKTDIVISVK